ncbi:MAG TPA: hypothetical protein VM711_09355 [Sphingomicrobium sp.]|nr:hypothetical protein [Sphingomicrobium sp.]
MYIDSAARPREAAVPDGGNDLSEGLMLLRASTLKIIRLQLAIERHDRQVALAAVDDLVALDRQLQDYLGVPATGEQLLFQRQLDRERAALNEEKLTLAAEILRRPASIAERLEPVEQLDLVEPDQAGHAEPVQEVEDWLGPCDLDLKWEEPRRSRWWLAIIPILLLSLGVAAYFFISLPDAAAWLDEAARAFR